MGSKGTQSSVVNTQANQTYTPAGAPYLTAALGAATELANKTTPTIPTAPVAGFSPQQQQAFGLAGNTGIQNPYLAQAQQYFSPSGAQQFANPFINNVTAQLQNVFGQQQAQNNANLIQSAGGVGADRIAVGQGNLANQQALAAGQTYAGLYNQAAQQAQSAAYGTAGLGAQAQQANLQDVNALLGAGGLQQQLAQAQANAPYQQQLAQIALPYQLSQWYSGQIGGLAPALGGQSVGSGTSNTVGQYNPSLFSQILGVGGVGAGLFGKGSGGSVPYARGGEVNPYAFDGGGVAPIDISKGLFSRSLIHLPDQSLPPAQVHIPNLNLNPQAAPNNMMAQQQQQDQRNLGMLNKALTNSRWGDAISDWSQDLFSARGGRIANPYRIPHFQDGGSDGTGDGGQGGGVSDPGEASNMGIADYGAPGGGGGGGGVGEGAASSGASPAGGGFSDPGIGWGGFSPTDAAAGQATANAMGFATYGAPSTVGWGGGDPASPANTAVGQAESTGMAQGLGNMAVDSNAIGNMFGLDPASLGPIGDYGQDTTGPVDFSQNVPTMFSPGNLAGQETGLAFDTPALGVNNFVNPPPAQTFAQQAQNFFADLANNFVTAITPVETPENVQQQLAQQHQQQTPTQAYSINPYGISPAQQSFNNLASIAQTTLGPNQGFADPSVANNVPGVTSPTMTAATEANLGNLAGVDFGTAPAPAPAEVAGNTPAPAPTAPPAAPAPAPETAPPAFAPAEPTAPQATPAPSPSTTPAEVAAALSGAFGGGSQLPADRPYGYAPSIPVGYAAPPTTVASALPYPGYTVKQPHFGRGGSANPYQLHGYALDGAVDDDVPFELGNVDANQGPYERLADAGIQRGQIDAAATQNPALATAIGRLESSGRGFNGPRGRFANELYQQYPAFAQQYGGGEGGIKNAAAQVLKANPNATFGDFYSWYVTGTGNPAKASITNLLTTTQPGARGAYANLMKNSPIDPRTPLASVIGGQGAPQQQPAPQNQTATAYAPADMSTTKANDTLTQVAQTGLPTTVTQGPSAAGPGSPASQPLSLSPAGTGQSGNLPQAAPSPGAPPTAGLPGQVPDAGQTIPVPPPATGGTKGSSGTGLFGKEGYLNKMMHDPARMALIMGGLSAFTPAGFAGGFQQGMQLMHQEQSAELMAKRLDQEAQYHQQTERHQTAQEDLARRQFEFNMGKPTVIHTTLGDRTAILTPRGYEDVETHAILAPPPGGMPAAGAAPQAAPTAAPPGGATPAGQPAPAAPAPAINPANPADFAAAAARMQQGRFNDPRLGQQAAAVPPAAPSAAPQGAPAAAPQVAPQGGGGGFSPLYGGIVPWTPETTKTLEEREQMPSGSAEARDPGVLKYVARMDPMKANQIRLAANYMLDPSRVFSMKAGERENFMKLVSAYDPTWNAMKYGEIQDALKKFGAGPQGNAIRSLDVASQHMDQVRQLAHAMHNGDWQVFNQIKNSIAELRGKPDVTNFNAAAAIAADEIVKAVVGSAGGALADREGVLATLSKKMSPAQIDGVMDTYTGLMGGQLLGMKRQYERTTSLKNFDQEMLSPAGRRAIELANKHSAPVYDPTDPEELKKHAKDEQPRLYVAPMPKIGGKEEYDKLPSGATFEINGQTWTKP